MTLKKIGGIAFATGFVIPGFLMVLERSVTVVDLHPGMWLSNVYIVLWPAALVLFDAPDGWRGYLFLFITILVNGLLYAFVAVLVAYYVRLVKNRGYDFRDD